MADLKRFASFVKKQKLEEFITGELQMLRSFQLPLLNFLSKLDENELRELMRVNLVKFLTALENSTELEFAREGLSNWENDSLPLISNKQVSLTDLVFIYYAQKASLTQLIPFFTEEVKEVMEISRQLEEYYLEVQQMATKVLEKIQEESNQKQLEHEEKYRDLFDNATDLIQFVAPEGRILYVNKAWQTALGYAEEELEGKSIYDFVIPRERERFRAYRSSIISGARDLPAIITVFQKKNGGEIIIEGFISCKFKNGVPLYTRGILRNITKRVEDEKKLEFFTEQLLEREENFRNLIRHAPDAIIVINELSEIQLWNPKAEELFGWKMEEVMGEPLMDTIMPPKYQTAHLHGMNRLLSTGESHILNKTVEVTAINKNQQEFFISLTISRAMAGAKNLFIAFLRDISRQKQNELELEERRKQLERSNEELEQFAWLTSHDLKEPLRKILTFIDLLLRKHSDDLDQESGRYLEKISVSATRMNNLIEAILVYSNISEEKKQFEPVDLNKIISEVIADLEIVIKEKHATVTVENLPVIEAVTYQMQQLFQNLLSNALKYSKPGTAPVVSISCSSDHDREFEINISDNGIGFDNIYAEKIFQVFQRLETSDRYAGTGIGLALCKKIVEAHGGRIIAKGREGEGSVFTIFLPLQQSMDKKNPQGEIAMRNK